MTYYDIDNDGNVSFDEFLRGLRDPLTERRRKMVDKAFFLMDKDGSGKITVQDIAFTYDVSQNQDFKDGKKTKDDVLMGFLNEFDGAKGNNDGTVTNEEWNDYYTDLSMSTPSDDYFVVMMEQAWCISEVDSGVEFVGKVNHFIDLFKRNVLVFVKGNTDDAFLNKLFEDYDKNREATTGVAGITIDELAAMMYKFEVPIERKYIQGALNAISGNKSGLLKCEEFKAFIRQ